MTTVSRRALLAGTAGIVAASRFSFAADPDVPVITKRVEKRYKVAITTQPNDLQFTPEGLWILDQLDQPTNKAILVDGDTTDRSARRATDRRARMV
jgi:hypothetical protein